MESSGTDSVRYWRWVWGGVRGGGVGWGVGGGWWASKVRGWVLDVPVESSDRKRTGGEVGWAGWGGGGGVRSWWTFRSQFYRFCWQSGLKESPHDLQSLQLSIWCSCDLQYLWILKCHIEDSPGTGIVHGTCSASFERECEIFSNLLVLSFKFSP